MTVGDCEMCHDQVQEHERRITDIERRQDAQGSKLDSISRDIIAVRAEGNARAASAQASMDRLSADLKDMTRQLAEHTGAQKRQNEIREDELRSAKLRESSLKRYATIIGIVATLAAAAGSTLLSDQEVASTIWVKWLHLREPWDNSGESTK